MFEADEAIYLIYKLCFENILPKWVHIYIGYLFYSFHVFFLVCLDLQLYVFNNIRINKYILGYVIFYKYKYINK